MRETKSALLVGVGGQGAILTAKVLVNGLMKAGYDVKMSEVHGMSQRGGSVSTQVHWGGKVYSPVIGHGAADPHKRGRQLHRHAERAEELHDLRSLIRGK